MNFDSKIEVDSEKNEDLEFKIGNKKFNYSKQQINTDLKRIWCFAISQKSEYMVVGGLSNEKKIYIYKMKNAFEFLQNINVNSNLVYDIQFSFNDKYLSAGCQGQNIIVWNFENLINSKQEIYFCIKPEFGTVPKIYFSKIDYLLYLSGQTNVTIWNIEQKSDVKIIRAQNKLLSFSLMKNYLLQVGKISSIQIISILHSKIMKIYHLKQEENLEITSCQENQLIINAGREQIYTINSISGKALRIINIIRKVMKITFSKDQKYFFYGQASISSQHPDYIDAISISTGNSVLHHPTQFSQPTFSTKLMPEHFLLGNINQIEIWKLEDTK